MAQAGNNEDRFGGEYMIQDRDHMSEIDPVTSKAKTGNARQVDQSQANGGQQSGGSRTSAGQQGGERRGQRH